ncbi:MAG: nucleoside deaminase [Proteobacteria bacterium]|nr:MAG: nucleoside deaminase [Pseudomonadota bacterium]
MDSAALDLHFMGLALAEARKALGHDDIPVGAVLVRGDQVLAVGRNERELLHSPTAHAEVQAINAGAEAHGHWNLTGTKLYVTLEPCPMCAGALVMARVEEVIYAACDPKGGALSLDIPILANPKLNHRVKFRQGPLVEECSQVLKEFFREKRALKKPKP